MNNIFSNARTLLTALIVLGVSACATTLKSSIDQADSADLSTYKTYAWISEQPLLQSNTAAPELINPVNKDRVRRSIENELERKGYVKVPIADADFVVAFTLGARVQIRNYYDNFGYGYHGFYHGYSRFGSRYGGFGGTSSVRTFTEGTLVLDIFDNAQRKAIWHGSAAKSLYRDGNGQELIAEAVAALLGQFPDRRVLGP